MDLGEHLAENRGSISKAKISEILNALNSLAARGRAQGASSVLAVGTRALREARNAGAVVRAARVAGVPVEVASGEREAELAYLCATGGAPNRLVSDFGSQSLEIAWRTENAIETRCVDPGYVDAYADWFRRRIGIRRGSRRIRCVPGPKHRPVARGNRPAPLPRIQYRGIVRARAGRRRRSPTGRSPAPRSTRQFEGSSGLPPALVAGATATRSARAEKVLPGLVVLDHLMRRSGHREAAMVEAELPVGLIVDHLARAGGLPPAGVRMRSGRGGMRLQSP